MVIADQLDMYSCFAAPSLPPCPQPPETSDQVGVELGIGLVSRWPILKVSHHELPSTHRPYAPVALLATLEHPAGPLHVRTGATEWEPAYADDHLAQTRRLAQLASAPELNGLLPVLLAADLNAEPESVEMQPLLEAMIDTWTAGGGDPDMRTLRSEHPFAPSEARKQLDRRIDYVLARPGRPDRKVHVRDVFSLGDPVDGLHPSDHDAVVAQLDLDNPCDKRSSTDAEGHGSGDMLQPLMPLHHPDSFLVDPRLSYGGHLRTAGQPAGPHGGGVGRSVGPLDRRRH